MRRVLFLDVDGVLNSREWWQSEEYQARAKRRRGALSCRLDPHAMRRLNTILYETRAEIVLSSTWRVLPGHERALRAGGLRHPIVDRTGRLHCEGQHDRTAEISLYLNEHRDVGDYVILDDTVTWHEALEPYVVRTDWQVGLTDDHVRDAIELLHEGPGPRKLHRRFLQPTPAEQAWKKTPKGLELTKKEVAELLRPGVVHGLKPERGVLVLLELGALEQALSLGPCFYSRDGAKMGLAVLCATSVGDMFFETRHVD